MNFSSTIPPCLGSQSSAGQSGPPDLKSDSQAKQHGNAIREGNVRVAVPILTAYSIYDNCAPEARCTLCYGSRNAACCRGGPACKTCPTEIRPGLGRRGHGAEEFGVGFRLSQAREEKLHRFDGGE